MPNQPGRPKGRGNVRHSVSMPVILLDRLRDYAKWTGQGVSAVVVKAVVRYLDHPPTDEKTGDK